MNYLKKLLWTTSLQGEISFPLNKLPVNTALLLLIDTEANLERFRVRLDDDVTQGHFNDAIYQMEKLALFLRPASRQQLSRYCSTSM